MIGQSYYFVFTTLVLVQSSDCVRKPSDLARFRNDFFEQISNLLPEERWEHEHANKNEAKLEPTLVTGELSINIE